MCKIIIYIIDILKLFSALRFRSLLIIKFEFECSLYAFFLNFVLKILKYILSKMPYKLILQFHFIVKFKFLKLSSYFSFIKF